MKRGTCPKCRDNNSLQCNTLNDNSSSKCHDCKDAKKPLLPGLYQARISGAIWKIHEGKEKLRLRLRVPDEPHAILTYLTVGKEFEANVKYILGACDGPWVDVLSFKPRDFIGRSACVNLEVHRPKKTLQNIVVDWCQRGFANHKS